MDEQKRRKIALNNLYKINKIKINLKKDKNIKKNRVIDSTNINKQTQFEKIGILLQEDNKKANEILLKNRRKKEVLDEKLLP